MEKKQKNKWLSFLADGMLSGLMIGIGCVVSMSCENRYLGAFLFSLGLFCIVQFQYGLYTGKVGYIFDRDKAYLGETFFTFLANAMLLPSGESTNIPRKMSNDDRIGMSSSEGQIMPPLTRDADCFDTL